MAGLEHALSSRERGARGYANGAGRVRVREAHATGRKPVEMGRLHDRVTRTTHVSGIVLVRHNDQDIACAHAAGFRSSANGPIIDPITAHGQSLRAQTGRVMRSAPSPSTRTESRELTRELARRLSERLALSQRPAQQVSAGVALLKSGDSVTRLPLIIQGRVDSVLHLHGDDGGRVIPVSWNDGEFVLLSQLFMGRPSFVDLIAATNLSLRWASVAEMEEALLQDSDMLVLLVRVLAQRLREVQTRERIWVERGVHQRLCATLARLAQQSEKDEAGHALIVATHEELAERSGVSRPKLSKELKRLELEGRVKLERKTVRVVDLTDLFDPAD